MQRQFTLEYWIDDGWYVGKLKEVHGVFSQGETLNDLEENIKDAYALVMEEETADVHPGSKTKEIVMDIAWNVESLSGSWWLQVVIWSDMGRSMTYTPIQTIANKPRCRGMRNLRTAFVSLLGSNWVSSKEDMAQQGAPHGRGKQRRAGELEALCFAQCVRDISVVFEKEKENAETG
jgi:predicted RNase H-like HicB family nuclease